MNRRQIFGLLGLGGAGMSLGAVANEQTKPTLSKEDMAKMEGTHGITFLQTYGEPIPPSKHQFAESAISVGPQYIPGTTKQVNAQLNVGPDGHLYAKVNNKWKKLT